MRSTRNAGRHREPGCLDLMVSAVLLIVALGALVLR